MKLHSCYSLECTQHIDALAAENAKLLSENEKLSDLWSDMKQKHDALQAQVEALKADAARYEGFVEDMCNETFDTWTTGYQMQKIAFNLRKPRIDAAIKGGAA